MACKVYHLGGIYELPMDNFNKSPLNYSAYYIGYITTNRCIRHSYGVALEVKEDAGSIIMSCSNKMTPW